MPLTIEQIRAARTTLPRREVPTPDLGDGASVWVRSLTCEEVQGVQDLIAKNRDRPLVVSRRLVELAACNEDGSPLFVGEDKALIAGLPWGAVDTIADAVMVISGMKKGEKGDDAEDDARKN